MTTAAATSLLAIGGGFLLEDRAPEEIFIAEDLTNEHLDIARTVDEFWAHEVEPHLQAIRRYNRTLALRVIPMSAELGLTAIPIPQRLGAMEMDLASVMT